MSFRVSWLNAGFVVVGYALTSGMGVPASLPGHRDWAVAAALVCLQVVIAAIIWAIRGSPEEKLACEA